MTDRVPTAIRHRVPAHERAAGRYHAPEAGRRYLHNLIPEKGRECIWATVANVGIANAKKAAEAAGPTKK